MSKLADNVSADDLAAHFKYLDELRESGVTNMYGAARYLASAEGVDLNTARIVLQAWMRTFGAETAHTRAAIALAEKEGAAK